MREWGDTGYSTINHFDCLDNAIRSVWKVCRGLVAHACRKALDRDAPPFPEGGVQSSRVNGYVPDNISRFFMPYVENVIEKNQISRARLKVENLQTAIFPFVESVPADVISSCADQY